MVLRPLSSSATCSSGTWTSAAAGLSSACVSLREGKEEGTVQTVSFSYQEPEPDGPVTDVKANRLTSLQWHPLCHCKLQYTPRLHSLNQYLLFLILRLKYPVSLVHHMLRKQQSDSMISTLSYLHWLLFNLAVTSCYTGMNCHWHTLIYQRRLKNTVVFISVLIFSVGEDLQ